MPIASVPGLCIPFYFYKLLHECIARYSNCLCLKQLGKKLIPRLQTLALPPRLGQYMRLIEFEYSLQLMKRHYANMSVQYTAIFHSCKNDNFQMKIFDIFLIFAQNIDCGYTLEPPQ